MGAARWATTPSGVVSSARRRAPGPGVVDHDGDFVAEGCPANNDSCRIMASAGRRMTHRPHRFFDVDDDDRSRGPAR